MADIFGTETNKTTQAVIDAASKILMGIKDDETAKAQTEDQHPAVAHVEEAVDKAARYQMIKTAAKKVEKQNAAKEKQAMRDAKSAMRKPGATKGMAEPKMDESVDFDEFLDSLDEQQLAEISAKLARKAAASSQAKSFEYGSSAYGPGTDKEADRLEKKADKARAHVEKRQGDKGVKKVDKMTGKMVYGESIEDDHEHAVKRVEKHLGQVQSPKHKAKFQKQFDRHKFYYDVNYDNDTGQEHEVVSDMHRLADNIKKHNSTTMKKEQYVREAEDLDAAAADKAIKHDCASHVVHKEHGEGQCVPGMHTIVETAEGEGYVTHYDVMFDHGIEYDVPVEDLEIVTEMSHGHPRKKK